MKLDVILTIQDQEQDLIDKTSIKSINKYINYINSVTIINSNENINIDTTNEKINLVNFEKSTKLKKLKLASKILEKNEDNNMIIVLDADDELINIDIFQKLDINKELILCPQIYFIEGKGTFERNFDYSQKNWKNSEKFPYYGNQSIIVSKKIFCQSMDEFENELFQRGEDGYRMLQYLTKANNIFVHNVPFTKFNRFNDVDHTSLKSIENFSEKMIKGINDKFSEFVRMIKCKQIILWHFSQLNWFEISYKKYESILSCEIKREIKKLNLKEGIKDLKLVLTIYDPTLEEIKEWASYNLDRNLIILNDNPKLDDAKREAISNYFPNSQILELGVNKKRFGLISTFVKSVSDYFDFYFKIVDPDDLIYMEGYKKINRFINDGLFPNAELVLHRGTKIHEPKNSVINKSKKELLEISKDHHFQLTFATFQTIHKTKILKKYFEKIKNKEFTIQFQDDRLLTFLYLSNNAKITKIDIPFYIQFHRNGQTKETISNKINYIKETRKLYKFAAKNMDVVSFPSNKNKDWKYLLGLRTCKKVMCINDISKLISNEIKYDNDGNKILTIVITLANKKMESVIEMIDNLKEQKKNGVTKFVDFIIVYRNDEINYDEIINENINLFKDIVKVESKEVKKIGKILIVREKIQTKYVRFHDPDDLLIYDGILKLVNWLKDKNAHYINSISIAVQDGIERKYNYPSTNAVSIFRSDVLLNFENDNKWAYDGLFSEDTFRFLSWLIYFENKFNEEIQYLNFDEAASLTYVINDEGISSEYMIRVKGGHIFNFDSNRWAEAISYLASISNIINEFNYEVNFESGDSIIDNKIGDLIKMIYMYLIKNEIDYQSINLPDKAIELIEKYILINDPDRNLFKELVIKNEVDLNNFKK